MEKQNRRQALMTLSALALAGCGGGEELGTSAAGTSGQAAALEGAKALGATAAPKLPPQFLIWDAGSGPSRDYWCSHLLLRWKNPNVGDWLDAAGTPQGTVPFASFQISSVGIQQVDITALAARWVSSGENRGVFLRGAGTTGSTQLSAYALLGGRLAANPPQLQVTTDQGSYVCSGRVATINPSTYRSLDTRQGTKLNMRTPVLVQFDLDEVRGTVQSAVMRLDCLEAYRITAVSVFEVDAPRFQLGGDGATPRMGIAAAGEAALRTHPSVLRMGDFSNLNRGVVFNDLALDSRNPIEQLPDPDAPGTVMLRGSFTPNANNSFSGVVQLLRADPNDPLRPALPALYEELYARMYFFLEDDWCNLDNVHKMALGWDLRMGWWNDYAGGYWYTTTGNGGVPGSGKKVFWPKGRSGGVQLYDRWAYEGHSVRMMGGLEPALTDDTPYRKLRAMQDYVYSLDQAASFGDYERLGTAVYAKGRWHCVEQRIKINSVDTTVTDELGNGEANPDGEIDTWLDGVLVEQRRGLRWRCHPEMGIRGPWINWYYGGRTRPVNTMHYRMNHFVVSTEYIGPRVA